MPSKRTKDGETVVINVYCDLYGATVVNRPEPPDAIIQYRTGAFSWIEVSSVWSGQSQDNHKSEARALNDPYSHGQAFVHTYRDYWKDLEPDFLCAIRKKDSNGEYQSSLEKFGKGVLILNLESPYY